MAHRDVLSRVINVGDKVAINGNPIKAGIVRKLNEKGIVVEIIGAENIQNPNWNPRDWNPESRMYENRNPDLPHDWRRTIPNYNNISFQKTINVYHTVWKVMIIGDVYLGNNEKSPVKEAISNLEV